MEFYEALSHEGITRISDKESEQQLIQKLLDLTYTPGRGQFRGDVPNKAYNVAFFKFGTSTAQFSPQQTRDMKGTRVQHIYLDNSSQLENFTIIGQDYVQFLEEIFHSHEISCYFFPSPSVNRSECYQGRLETFLSVLRSHYHEIYEFSLADLNFHWVVDREHHKILSILGDQLAKHAFHLSSGRYWQNRTLLRDFIPKSC